MGGRPLRLRTPRKRATVLGPVWAIILAKEMTPHSNTSDSPPKKQISVVFDRFGTVFNQMVGAPRFSR